MNCNHNHRCKEIEREKIFSFHENIHVFKRENIKSIKCMDDTFLGFQTFNQQLMPMKENVLTILVGTPPSTKGKTFWSSYQKSTSQGCIILDLGCRVSFSQRNWSWEGKLISNRSLYYNFPSSKLHPPSQSNIKELML